MVASAEHRHRDRILKARAALADAQWAAAAAYNVAGSIQPAMKALKAAMEAADAKYAAAVAQSVAIHHGDLDAAWSAQLRAVATAGT